MISIGAAIIVKNAAETISTAIQSVLPICSQIVVVDTGSSDKTPSICSKLGAEVYFHKWIDDFSVARNVALSLMRTEWIIAIDADEELIISDKNSWNLTPSPSPKERGDKQRTSSNSSLLWSGAGGEVLQYLDLLENPQIGGLNILIKNYLGTDSSSSVSTHRYTRIFRKYSKIRYEGRIHEQIRPAIEKAGFTVADTDILIKHYGYSEINPEKIKRNIMLLERELSENPNDNWSKYHLAETEFTAKNYIKAKELYGEIFDSSVLSTEQKEMSKIRLAQIELSFEKLNEMEQWLNFVSNDKDIEGLRLFITAAKLSLQRRFAEALKIYQSEEVSNSSLVDKNKLKEAAEIMAILIKKFISI